MPFPEKKNVAGETKIWYWQKRKKHRLMELDKKPRINLHLWSVNLQQRRQDYIMEKKQSLQ